MANKLDGVKVSAKKAGSANQRKNPAVKQVKKKPASKTRPPAKINMPPKNQRSVISIIVSIIITALTVGGMIYIWQNTTNTNKIELAEKEAQNLKYDLEEKLSKTKNKLVGVESENADLKTVNEKLQAKTDALNVAKRGFVSEDLGFSFFYPATFGEASAEIEEGLEGKKFMGKFSDNDKFVFGGITKDYISSSSPEAVFTAAG